MDDRLFHRNDQEKFTAQVKRLGNPYYSTKEKGTGLGTMVAFSIIKSMGGRIAVQSKLGKGTTIKMIFPQLKDAQLSFAEVGENGSDH
ncbi:ATP-binding protein [Ammoniphilus sp. 3BR4]|uniref:ATP-binding protein n=1 Tax=Ammoniphilus sp. 3BR4 TaxID=3158265 RepID=UPI0034673152